jgi:GNAT superfamily N-acetyltransferase
MRTNNEIEDDSIIIDNDKVYDDYAHITRFYFTARHINAPKLPKGLDPEEKWKDDETVGRVCLYAYDNEPDVFYLSSLWVKESERNRGLGYELLNIATDYAIGYHAKFVWLKVLTDSWVHDWFKKFSFKDMSVKDEYTWMKAGIKALTKGVCDAYPSDDGAFVQTLNKLNAIEH